MSWWLLLCLVFLTWILWAFAAVIAKAAKDEHDGVPKNERHGTSIAPIIPFFPLLFFGLAKLGDWLTGNWGTIVVGGLHAILMLVFLSVVALGLHQLYSTKSSNSS